MRIGPIIFSIFEDAYAGPPAPSPPAPVAPVLITQYNVTAGDFRAIVAYVLIAIVVAYLAYSFVVQARTQDEAKRRFAERMITMIIGGLIGSLATWVFFSK